MKAILVIDMPSNCDECPCFIYDGVICGALNEELFVNKEEEPIKSKRCPLKPYDEDFIKDAVNDYGRLRNE